MALDERLAAYVAVRRVFGRGHTLEQRNRTWAQTNSLRYKTPKQFLPPLRLTANAFQEYLKLTRKQFNLWSTLRQFNHALES